MTLSGLRNATRLTVDVRKAFDTGIGTYIREVVPRVIRSLRGVEVEVLVQRGDATKHAYLDGCAATTVEIGARPFSLTEQVQLRSAVRHSAMFWATSLSHPLYPRIATVHTVHDVAQLALARSLGGSIARRLLARPFFDSIRRRSSLVLFNSDFTAAEFRRLVGAPMSPSVAVPLGVGSSWFDVAAARAARPLPEPYFVMLGSLRAHKNFALALHALARVSSALPHKLLVIGPDWVPPRSTMASAPALQRVLSDRVVFAGPLSLQRVQAAVQQAEALLFPSFYEGFGLPVLEAMACGCPVLVARNGISPDLAADCAMTFDPNDADELARTMVTQTMLAPDERLRRIDAGIARARGFSWEQTAERTVASLACAFRKLPGAAQREAVA